MSKRESELFPQTTSPAPDSTDLSVINHDQLIKIYDVSDKTHSSDTDLPRVGALFQKMPEGVIPPPLYRGDLRTPDTIFREGFQALGKDANLIKHVVYYYSSSAPSQYISTTVSKEVASKFPQGAPPVPDSDFNHVYEIHTNK